MSFSKLRLINADLRKCADSSYTKSVLRVVAERDFAAVAVGNTGRAAVYETSDVFLCLLFLFSFNRLNINLLKELRQKQWFQTLIKKNDAFIHQTLTKRSHAVIVRLENHCGPFVFRVTCLDIVPSLK